MLTPDEIHKMAAVEAEHWWYRGLRETFFTLLAPYVADRGRLRILDIGCGTGGNLLELCKLGDARGVDIDPLCVDYCVRKGLRSTLGSMHDLPEPAASTDLVTMFDVLTQADPSETNDILRNIHRVLARDGLLAFRETAMPIAGGAHDRAVGVLQRFTKRGLRRALVETGFEPLRLTYVNSLLFPPIVLARRLQDLLRPGAAASDVRQTSPVANAVLLGVLAAERQLLRVTDLPFGVSIFGVARKTA